MRLVAALIIYGLMLFMSGCGPAQWLTRTEIKKKPVPAEYLIPRQLPAPPRRIDWCPVWAEQLKTVAGKCEGDKTDIKAWSDRPLESD
mgnify:CR=1 FL=1